MMTDSNHLTPLERLQAKFSTGNGNDRGQPVHSTNLIDWVARIRDPEAETKARVAAARPLKTAYDTAKAAAMEYYGNDTESADKDPTVKKAKAAYGKVKDKSEWGSINALFLHRRDQKYPCTPTGNAFGETDRWNTGQTPAELRDHLAQHPSVIAAWNSIGGNGVHFVVALDPTPETREQHETAQKQACRNLGMHFAVHGQTEPDGIIADTVYDRERFTYLSHDPDAYLADPETIIPFQWTDDTQPPEILDAPDNAETTAAGQQAGQSKQSKSNSNGTKNKQEKPKSNAFDPDQKKNNPHWQFFANHSPVRNSDWRAPLAVAIRMLADHTDSLVIGTREVKDKKGRTNTIAIPFCFDPQSGLLKSDSSSIDRMIQETLGTMAGAGYKQLEKEAWAAFHGWVARMRSSMNDIIDRIPTANNIILDLAATLPRPIIKPMNDFNNNPAVWGVANGALDIHSKSILAPSQARPYLITANTGVPYIPDAYDPDVDTVMPMGTAISEFYGWSLTHWPQRDFGAEVGPPGSTKTTRQYGMELSMGKADDNGYISEAQVSAFNKPFYAKAGDTYNNQIFGLANPLKMCFIPEIKPGLDLNLIKNCAGQPYMTARKIHNDDERFRVGAHMLFQGNQPDEGETLFGISATDNSDDAKAIRDRIRMLPVTAIPEDQQDKGLWGRMNHDPFKRAMLARCVDMAYAMKDYGDIAPKTDAMLAREEEQAQSERADWIQECLVPAVEPRPTGDQGPPLDAWHVDQLVSAWWTKYKDRRDGEAPSSREIRRVLTALYGPPAQSANKRTTVKKRHFSNSTEVKTYTWPEFRLTAEAEYTVGQTTG